MAIVYASEIATPTVTIDTPYLAGQVVGGVISFDLRPYATNGFIRQVTLIDENPTTMGPFDIYWFDATPSIVLDGGEYDPTVADLQKLIGISHVLSSRYTNIGTHAFHYDDDLNYGFKTAKKSMYAYLVCTGGTPSYAATDDLSIKLGALITD